LELRRHWYVSITEETRISAIGVINVQFLYECEKKMESQNSTELSGSTALRVTTGAKMIKHSAKTRVERRKHFEYFKWPTVVRLVNGMSGNIGRVKRKGNEAPNTVEGNER
jgi:hypothetical protein